MTNPYRAMCAELITAVDDATESVDRTSDCVNAANYPELWAECMELIRKHDGLLTRARALLDQPEPKEPLYGGDQRWMFERDARQESRKKFLTIAAELEAIN